MRNKEQLKIKEDSTSSILDIIVVFTVICLLVFVLNGNHFVYSFLTTIFLIIIFYYIYAFRWFKKIIFNKDYFEIEYPSFFKMNKKYNYSLINKIFFKDKFDRNPSFLRFIFEGEKIFFKCNEEDAVEVFTFLFHHGLDSKFEFDSENSNVFKSYKNIINNDSI